jgi:hypothetical protein
MDLSPVCNSYLWPLALWFITARAELSRRKNLMDIADVRPHPHLKKFVAAVHRHGR